jgi:hypothetical protein
MPANADTFNIQILRAVAHLYEQFPTPTTVEHSTLIRKNHGAGNSSIENGTGSERGTILWLHRNGFIDGVLLESNPLEGNQTAAITDAQLTPKALRVLREMYRNPSNASERMPLGQLAIGAAFGSNESAVADLLSGKLLSL